MADDGLVRVHCPPTGVSRDPLIHRDSLYGGARELKALGRCARKMQSRGGRAPARGPGGRGLE